MELTDLVRQYVRTRDNFVLRIARISEQLSQWTDQHSQSAPSLNDVARFEGLRAERARLLSEFTEAEDSFVVEMLRKLSSER